MVAAQAHYHSSCYRHYVRPEKTKSSGSSDQVKDDAEEKAFSDLFAYLRSEVLEKQSITTMTQLTKKLEIFAEAHGQEHLSESIKKHIKRKLEAEFGPILVIFPHDKGKLIVVPDDLSVEKVVKTNLTMEKELDILRSHSHDISNIIDQSSTYVRKSILDMEWKTPWPIHPPDVDVQLFPVPECLSHSVLGVLTTNVNKPSESQESCTFCRCSPRATCMLLHKAMQASKM